MPTNTNTPEVRLKPAAYHGVRNGKFALRLGDNSYSTDLLPLKYLKTISYNPSLQTSSQHADDREILQAVADTGITGAIGSTAPDPDLERTLGWKQDIASGVADVSVTQQPSGALYYETTLAAETGGKNLVLKVWLLNVVLKRSNETFKTNAPAPDFGDYSYDYTSRGEALLAADGEGKYLDEQGFEHAVYRVTCLPGEAGYDTFGDAVPAVKEKAAE